MEFDREVFDLMPSGSKTFNLIGLKCRAIRIYSFARSKRKPLINTKQRGGLCMNWKLTIGITIFTN